VEPSPRPTEIPSVPAFNDGISGITLSISPLSADFGTIVLEAAAACAADVAREVPGDLTSVAPPLLLVLLALGDFVLGDFDQLMRLVEDDAVDEGLSPIDDGDRFSSKCGMHFLSGDWTQIVPLDRSSVLKTN